MKQRKLIDYCTNPKNRCDTCPYDAECDIYFDMYGTTPACEENDHPERYTDDDIGLIDGELTIKDQIIQPEPHEGHWIDKGWSGDWAWQTDGRGNCWRVIGCSECGKNVSTESNYCPHCGVKMRRKIND